MGWAVPGKIVMHVTETRYPSYMQLERPTWPYYIGAWSAALFAFGVGLTLYAITAQGVDRATIQIAFWTFVLGSAGLGVGWFGIMSQRQAGFAPVGGSFAIPVAMLILKMSGPDDVMFAGGMLVLVAMAFFAIGHVFVKNLPLTRFFAVPGALVFTVEAVAVTAKWNIERDTEKVLGVIAMGSLFLIGASLAFTLPGLRLRRDDDDPEQL